LSRVDEYRVEVGGSGLSKSHDADRIIHSKNNSNVSDEMQSSFLAMGAWEYRAVNEAIKLSRGQRRINIHRYEWVQQHKKKKKRQMIKVPLLDMLPREMSRPAAENVRQHSSR
jgi:hypothetical protein